MNSFEDFFSKSLGISPEFFERVDSDDDWAFIIKMHAVLEGAFNHVIVSHFGDERLSDIISHLEMSDRKKGKLAIIKALEILPSETRGFVQRLSEMRNAAAHDVKNVNFDVKDWIDSRMKKDERDAFRKSMVMICQGKISQLGKDLDMSTIVVDRPRFAISMSAYITVFAVYWYADKTEEQRNRQLITPSAEPPVSSPTESK